MAGNATYETARSKRFARADIAKSYWKHLGKEKPVEKYLRFDTYGWDRMYNLMITGVLGLIEKIDGCIILTPHTDKAVEPFIFEPIT